jgi:hypothetical protein
MAVRRACVILGRWRPHCSTQNLSVSNAAAGGTTVAGGNQIGLATGIRHSF